MAELLQQLVTRQAELRARRHELTQWFSGPSLLNYMAKQDVVAQNDFPALKRLPQNGNGKIDRRALREQFQQSLSKAAQA